MAQTVKRLPAMWETRVQSLGREDLLEKEMAPHSSILAWKIPWTEEPGRLQSTGSHESDTTERLHFTSLLCNLEPTDFVSSKFHDVGWLVPPASYLLLCEVRQASGFCETPPLCF